MIPDDSLKIVVIPPEMAVFEFKNGKKLSKMRKIRVGGKWHFLYNLSGNGVFS
jgi:hypothetical protein